VSPILGVDARDPPTLILHGDADRGVPPAGSAGGEAEYGSRTATPPDHDFPNANRFSLN
jgi:hypothetical protein